MLTSLIALLVACTGEPKPVEAPDPEPAADANPEVPPVTTDDLQQTNEKVALVPSPMETQRALEASGIQTQLATLIPKHDFDMASGDTDQAAIRTGVVLADLLLTTKGASKPEIVSRLNDIATGMDQLGGGADIQATLKDFVERVQTDAVSRDELLKEFDELSGVMIPELEFNGQDRIVPLIEAGSWLEGANLVARAIKAAPDRSAAERLLKAPSVVDYFIKYVREEGADKAPPAVTKKLKEALLTLKGLAEKTEPLTDEDIDTVIRVTDDVLALM
ncbi:MAG: hypothetical protein R3F59_24035 [Myxococcota bacterium]